ncbi:MAG TPA: methyltransferase [Burkholderiales bacterium]|nr:methyltransferase [Burkholderiales bacterium]
MSNDGARPDLPPQAALYHLATGHFFSHAIFLAAKLGIADLLADGPKSSELLAEATGAHAPSLHRVMRLLASAGVFEELTDGCYALTSLGACLRADTPGSARAMVMLFAGDRIQNNWKDLEYCVRTGQPAYRKRGVDDPFKDPMRDAEDYAIFDAAMADLTRQAATAVADAYDFAPVRVVADIGGGSGALLIGILGAHPHLRGIVFDQPHAAERARKAIVESGLAHRCEAVGGDFFRGVPPGADAYILKHVIHDWDDDRATKILMNCHRAMHGNGRLLIVEPIYPLRADPSFANRRAFTGDVNMLVSTGGRQRSESDFRALYEAAGFALHRIVPTRAGVSVVEGIRAH